MSEAINWPSGKVIRLHNVLCAYCGRLFDHELLPTKEHVIGRRFVPRGCFDGQWNLLLNACASCNREKSDLEDDISAISMLPDLTGRFAVDDPRLASEAKRKAVKSRSRRTGRAVADSQENFTMRHQFGNATFTFNFTSPAQIDEDRAFTLASYHFKGFFYWITYKKELRRGHFVKGVFFPFMVAKRADWGNAHLRWFMECVRDWNLRVHAVGADGFFKILIRRHPEDLEVWAWALEWNHGIRVAGFAGDEKVLLTLAGDMPPLAMRLIHQDAQSWIRTRTEIPLPPAEDDLFVLRGADGTAVITE
jgi:hypothetical protein